MRADDELEQSRIFHGPGALEVYVPPNPPPHPDDYRRDFPPGEPPEVRYLGVTANYWMVLREGRMPFMSGTKVFTEDQMEWLRGIEKSVQEMLMQ